MAVPKKRVSKMRKNLRHTNWKKEIIPQALIALSKGKSSRLLNGLRSNTSEAMTSGADSIELAPPTTDAIRREPNSNG